MQLFKHFNKTRKLLLGWLNLPNQSRGERCESEQRYGRYLRTYLWRIHRHLFLGRGDLLIFGLASDHLVDHLRVFNDQRRLRRRTCYLPFKLVGLLVDLSLKHLILSSKLVHFRVQLLHLLCLVRHEPFHHSLKVGFWWLGEVVRLAISRPLVPGVLVVRLELSIPIPAVVVLVVLELWLPTSLALLRLIVPPREVWVVPPTGIIGI